MYFIKKNNDDKKSFVEDFQDMFIDSIFSNKTLKTDILENDKEYILKVELPGINKKDINLDFDNHYLNLSINCTEEKEDTSNVYIRRERSSRSYSRSYYLEYGDEDKINAKLENGILDIVVGKVKDPESKKKISVE